MTGADRDVSGDGRTSERTHGPRFVVDAMLGSLARWLRLVGFDTLYDASWTDREIVRTAIVEQRIVLTRDRGLLARRLLKKNGSGLLVDADRLEDQLAIVLDELGIILDERHVTSRCSGCNGPLVPAGAQQIERMAPPYVRRTSTRFSSCTGCGKLYWNGTHERLLRGRLAQLLASADRDSDRG